MLFLEMWLHHLILEPLWRLQRKQRLHSTRLQSMETDIVWPVFVVRGNGDVIMAYTDLRRNKSG